jgi:RNA polymerase sigma-70 factor (ECF subfamily)
VENEHLFDTDRSIGKGPDLPDVGLSNENLNAVINEAVKTLEPMQREVFLLRELGDVAFKDIAHIMNCPINTALGRMRLALKNIRKELKKRGIHGVQ